MLKPLKNQSKKKILITNSIKNFIKEQLWQHIFMVAFVFFCGWLCDKLLISPFFYICHYVIRSRFDKQYHCKHTKRSVAIKLCLWLSCTISFFAFCIILPLSVSLLSCIPVCYFIGWIGYIAQDRIDCRLLIKKLQSKTIWEMDEHELADYTFAKGIRGDMLEFVIMVVVYQMKYEEISKKLNYSVDTLKDWSPICKQKLGINSWKQHKN